MPLTGDQLAQLIARVTADLEAQPMDEGEAVAEPVGHFSLIVTNLPASLFFDDHLKVRTAIPSFWTVVQATDRHQTYTHLI